MSDVGAPVGINVAPFFGATVIGILLNTWLYGLMCMQCYSFFTTYMGERRSVKFYIFYLFLADTAHAGFMAAVIYEYLIVHFGDITYLGRAGWLFTTDPALGGIISASVQVFFAWRIKLLSERIWAPIIIVCLAVISGLGGIGTAIAATNWDPEFAEFQKFQVIVIIWLAGAALADVMIAAYLIWYLNKKKTGFQVTDDIIKRIVRLTMQTGFLTAACATLNLILFLASTSDAHLAINVPLSKLYTNSLLSTLNARVVPPRSESQGSGVISSNSRRVIEASRARKYPQAQVLNLSKISASVPEEYETHEMSARGQPAHDDSSLRDEKDGRGIPLPDDPSVEYTMYGKNASARYNSEV